MCCLDGPSDWQWGAVLTSYQCLLTVYCCIIHWLHLWRNHFIRISIPSRPNKWNVFLLINWIAGLAMVCRAGRAPLSHCECNLCSANEEELPCHHSEQRRTWSARSKAQFLKNTKRHTATLCILMFNISYTEYVISYSFRLSLETEFVIVLSDPVPIQNSPRLRPDPQWQGNEFAMC